MKILAQRLRKTRDLSGLSQLEASKKLDISNGTLSGYERDYRDPDTDTLYKMSILYNVSIDWLIGRIDDPRPSNKTDTFIETIANDPEMQRFFKEFPQAKEENRRKLYKIWEILKEEDEG